MESVWPVSKLPTESVGSRRELVANSCTHRQRRRDATRQFCRVGGVYWALKMSNIIPADLGSECCWGRQSRSLRMRSSSHWSSSSSSSHPTHHHSDSATAMKSPPLEYQPSSTCSYRELGYLLLPVVACLYTQLRLCRLSSRLQSHRTINRT